jgi:Tol biopolymer transport system component
MNQIKLILGVTLITISLGFPGVLAENSNLPGGNISASHSIEVLAPYLPGSETRLLPSNYDVWSCDWSPNGKALVFTGKIQGEDSLKMRVWYWELNPASEPALLTNTDQMADFAPRWSPDATKIGMMRRSFKSNNITSAIWLKDIPGGAGKQITVGPEDRDPSWAPDGANIVFSRGQGPYKADLISVNVTDGVTKVLLAKDGELLMNPWWGKDGKIYFTKFRPAPKTVTVSGKDYQVMDFGKGSIWAFNPDDNSELPIVVDECDNRTPVLSPDGTKLAFVSDRSLLKDLNSSGNNSKLDRGGLYIKDLKNDLLYFVTSKVGLNGASLSWSPDGKKIAFFTFRSIRPSIWVINLP